MADRGDKVIIEATRRGCWILHASIAAELAAAAEGWSSEKLRLVRHRIVTGQLSLGKL